MKKRILSLLLVLVLLLGVLPTGVLAASGDPATQVHVIVENTLFTEATEDSGNKEPAWFGTLVDTWVDLTSESTMMSCVVAALTEKGYTQTGAENNYISSINGLAEKEGSAGAGWMGTLNDWFTNVGFGGVTVADGTLSAGDEIRIMYTLAYGDDLGGSWANNDKTVKAIDFRVGTESVGTLDKTFDKDTHAYTLTVPEGTTGLLVLPTASNKNFQVRASIGETEYKRTQTLPVENGTVITVKCGDPEWPSMNNQADGTGASVPAETYTFTVKVGSDETPEPGQKHYLENIAIGPNCEYGGTELSSTFEMTPAFAPDVHEYTIVVPDNTTTVYPLPTLSADAPEGSKSVFTYLNYDLADMGLEMDEEKTYAPSTWGFQLSSLLGYNCKGSTVTLKVGTDDDFQTYTFTVKRQSSLSGVKLTSSTEKDAITYALDPKFDRTKTEGYTVYIPYDGAYLTATPYCSKDCTPSIKVNGEAFTNGSKLDASSLWTGNAGERQFDLKITVQNDEPATEPTTYTITCKELPTLAIKTQPTKTEYVLGDTLDTTGMEVTKQYHGQEPQTVDLDKLTITPSPLNKTGDEITVTVTYEGAAATLTVKVGDVTLSGSGTQEDPYLLTSAADLRMLSNAVSAGETYNGKYFKVTADITLPDNWTPIGSLKPGKVWEPMLTASDCNVFRGNIDGAKADGSGYYTITVPAGSQTMFGAVSNCTISNLNIYGTRIEGYGVVDYYCRNTTNITIENVTLKSGSHTKYSGFIGGYASGSNPVVLRNCKVEAGVIVGDNGEFPEWKDDVERTYSYNYGPATPQYNDMIGSFAGAFNGTIENCVSYAKVYGRNYVGGIMGFKGQSMGDCIVRGSLFAGEVYASGNYAGGIMGSGYAAGSAPNTPCVTIENCAVSGSVTGADCVGGIFGGNEKNVACWNNGLGYIRANYFTGKVSATADNAAVGGIIGHLHALNRYNIIAGNYYLAETASKGIGRIDSVDTAASSKFVRLDDPTGADADKLTAAFTTAELTNGVLTAKMNAASAGNAWQGDTPALSAAKRVVRMSTDLNSMRETTFKKSQGMAVLDSKKVTVTYSDGTTETIKASECAVGGLDFDTAGYQLVSLTYKNYTLYFGVLVNVDGAAPENPDKKAVTVTILGDSAHDVTTDSVHTLAGNNLTPWVTNATVLVANDATALDAFAAACAAYSMDYTATDSSYGGKYISSVTKGDVTLTDQTNKQYDGKSYSGWMYTVDGEMPMTTIDTTNVTSSLVVYFEDDYTLSMVPGIIEAIDALDTSATEEAISAIETQVGYLSPVAYASVTNMAKLTAARNALDFGETLTVSPATITATVSGMTIRLVGFRSENESIVLKYNGEALTVTNGKTVINGITYTVDDSAVVVKPVEVTVTEEKPAAAAPTDATEAETKAAERINNSPETKSEGLAEAASDKLIGEGAKEAEKVTAEEGQKVEVTAKPSLNIQVVELETANEQTTLTLEITPQVTYTTAVKNAETNETVGTPVVSEPQKIDNKDIKAPVTISIPLPAGMSTENLYIKHIFSDRSGYEYIKPTCKQAGGVWIATWQQSSFSTVILMADARTATVKLGSESVTLTPDKVGKDLPAASKDGMIFTGWSFTIDGEEFKGPYAKLTDDLLTKLSDAEKITATPNFKRPSSGNTTKIDSPNKKKDEPTKPDASKFRDVAASDWFFDSVQYALENGLMNGTSEWTFSPNDATTRGMIVTILARGEGVNTNGTPWYAAGQKWAMQNGISDGTNMPGVITREQLATILFRYAKSKGYDTSKTSVLTGFSDADKVSTYALEAMQWAVAEGLLQGVSGKLNPQGSATRAQAATILMRFMKNIAK